MAVQILQNNHYSTILDSLPKLDSMPLDPDLIRVQEAHGLQLIFYKDYLRLMQESDSSFLRVIHKNNLDIDKVGLIIEEIDFVNNPRCISDAKHYINPKKVYIRPMSTKKHRKVLEDTLEYFEKYNDSTKFDIFIETPLHETELAFGPGNMVTAIGNGARRGAQKAIENHKEDVIKRAKSVAAKTALAAGGLYAINKIAGHYTRKLADEDARKHPDDRSELIKKLRILKGKLPEYESKYQRAEREKWANRGVIGRIIYKIKMAISNIMHKLKKMIS